MGLKLGMGERLLEGEKDWQNHPTLMASVQKEGCLPLKVVGTITQAVVSLG